MKQRNMTSGILLITGVVALLGAGCATHQMRNSEATQRIGQAGLAVLVDSTVRVGVSGAPDAVSVPENATIAAEMLRAAEETLQGKGYVVSDTLLTVGAQLPAFEQVLVHTPVGTFESPGSLGKPFIVRPEQGNAAQGAKLNELFLWARKAKGPAPKAAVDVMSTPGLILLSCAGGNKQGLMPGSDKGVSITTFKPGVGADADAWSEVTLLLLDRTSGEVVWLERSMVTAFTPEVVTAEVNRLMESLPVAKARL